MKRIIKFRAWDKQNNCWYAPVHEAYNGNLFELLVGFGGDLSAHMMQGLVHESLWPDRFDLMQFTGLTDKNGKEIYEGDIIMRHIHLKSGDGIRVISEVEFNLLTAMFTTKPSDGDYSDNVLSDNQWEIIGNVFESPELLNS